MPYRVGRGKDCCASLVMSAISTVKRLLAEGTAVKQVIWAEACAIL